MKKLLYCLLLGAFFFTAPSVHAQFRKIPGEVTDAFKTQYPNAKSVNWEDKVTAFQATFVQDTFKYTARYDGKGVWLGSQKKITQSSLPAEVADGLSKSKYADWLVGTVTARYLPGNITQYGIFVSKNDLQRKNLLFSSKGQLLKDGNTL